MNVVHCSRCGRFLGNDQIRFIVGMHVTLDVDGCQGGDRVAEQLAAHMNRAGESSLGEVYTREMAFVLCTPCRESFVANPLSTTDELPAVDLGLLQ